MEQTVLQAILDAKVIGIVRGVHSSQICDLAQFILDGGLNCMEVTFDHTSAEGMADTIAAIKLLNEKFAGKMFIGAGTVMSVEEVHQAKEAGALYVISPNADEAVIRETKALGMVSIPGAMTATEAANAWAWGCDIVKLFPAGVLGTAYIKALKAPLKHIPVTAVGGVSPENVKDFLAAGCVGVGVGGNLVSAKLVKEGRFDEITKVAQAYVEAVKA